MARCRALLAGLIVTLAAVAAALGSPSAHAGPQPGLPDPVVVPTRAASTLTLLIAYSFGNRLPAGVDSQRVVGQPGPVNEALAAAVVRTRGDRDIPIYAQTEIAQVLTARYHLRGVIEIPPSRNADGTLTYLSTDGVAAKVVAQRGRQAHSDVAGVVAFSDHLWRAVYTTRVNGLAAYAPAGVTMPSAYDAKSGQPWTRSRAVYLPTDYAGRLALLPRLIGTR